MAKLALVAPLVYTPGGRALFATAPIPASAWHDGAPFEARMLVADELRKGWLRSRQSNA